MPRLGSTLTRIAFVLLLVGSGYAGADEKENGKRKALDPDGIGRLEARTGGQARVTVSRATGAASFVGLKTRAQGDLMAESRATARVKARAFLQEYSRMFGLRDVDAEVTLSGEGVDKLGQRHLMFEQSYRGVPVFAGMVRAHFASDGRLVTVNGNLIPGIQVNPNPTRSASEAAAMAIALVSRENEGREVYARSGTLTVYRTGLAKGVEGDSYLTWRIEVGNGSDIREFLFVDAHTGKVVDRLPGIMDVGLFRRAYDGQNLPNVPPEYPDTPFWSEGDSLPTSSTEADNMIIASKETYDYFFNAFVRDSFDGNGAIMDSIFNRGYGCPNASWNGIFISFCPGFTTDDVTGHEWGHAYTQYTHDLIYAWQSGALNEAYSDIWGETVDRLNYPRGTDEPNTLRTDDECSTLGGQPPPTLTITGGSAAGTYQAGASVNEPPRPLTVGPTDMALSNPPSACTAVTGVSGKIAIVDFTFINGVSQCASGLRATNVLNAGATGIIYVAPPEGILNIGSITGIASVQVTNADGALIKAGLLGAQATMSLGVGTANSVRWLMGEDITGGGALRDMWSPGCFGDPGKVSDTFQYACSTADGGGVHTNSGVPNHAFALLVDGGTYNGQTITALGLTKAAHIYFRAADVYQGPASNFEDHADALEASALDLVDDDLADLVTGDPSGQIITLADVQEVVEAMLAVEMRTPPDQCNFQPILQPNPPARCGTGLTQVALFEDDFESGLDGWTVSHDAVAKKDFTARDWEITNTPAHGPEEPPHPGSVVFAVDPLFGTCAPGGDESGVMHLTSPQITLPSNASNPLLTFDHYVATEPGFDGGNLKIRVNGGPYTVVAAADITFNPYNALLTVAGNTNPMAGEPGYTGTNGGEPFGSWGRTHVDLSNYAQPGDKVTLRWDFGTDGCSGNDGWYVDDVTFYVCLPELSIGNVVAPEGNSGKTTAAFTVTLSPASASDVTVQYKTADGTATSAGNNGDYVASGNKTLTIPAGATSATINVDVKGDTAVETDETFFVDLSNATNALIVDAQGQCTISNDD